MRVRCLSMVSASINSFSRHYSRNPTGANRHDRLGELEAAVVLLRFRTNAAQAHAECRPPDCGSIVIRVLAQREMEKRRSPLV